MGCSTNCVGKCVNIDTGYSTCTQVGLGGCKRTNTGPTGTGCSCYCVGCDS